METDQSLQTMLQGELGIWNISGESGICKDWAITIAFPYSG